MTTHADVPELGVPELRPITGDDLRSAMSLQQLSHAQNYIVHKMAVDPEGMQIIKGLGKKPPLDQ